jgi:hypothetical protein
VCGDGAEGFRPSPPGEHHQRCGEGLLLFVTLTVCGILTLNLCWSRPCKAGLQAWARVFEAVHQRLYGFRAEGVQRSAAGKRDPW